MCCWWNDGDSIQGEPIGTMTRGEANITLMNAMGYDVAIPGSTVRAVSWR